MRLRKCVYQRRRRGWGRKRRFQFRVTRNLGSDRVDDGQQDRVRFPRAMSEIEMRARAQHEALRRGLPQAKQTDGLLRVRDRRPVPARLIHAPSKLCFDENYDEMLGFIRDVQFLFYSRNYRSAKSLFVVDLSNVREVYLDAALVLSAEYHRGLISKPGYRPPIDDLDWPPRVRKLLEMLGFYKLVRSLSRSSDGQDDVPFEIKFVPFVHGFDVRGELVDELIEKLKDAAGATPKRIATYGALLEAIKNVRNHAYPQTAAPQLPPRVEAWWGAGAYYPRRGTLAFAMLDQGIGIPATLPARSIWDAVKRLCPPEFNDSDVIAGAIELGRTSTGLLERGNGLWTICRLVTELPGSHVRILSGRGELIYASDGSVDKKLHDNPFCGTLIEWSLVLPLETPSGAVS